MERIGGKSRSFRADLPEFLQQGPESNHYAIHLEGCVSAQTLRPSPQWAQAVARMLASKSFLAAATCPLVSEKNPWSSAAAVHFTPWHRLSLAMLSVAGRSILFNGVVTTCYCGTYNIHAAPFSLFLKDLSKNLVSILKEQQSFEQNSKQNAAITAFNPKNYYEQADLTYNRDRGNCRITNGRC
jgi:hypothetical protein